MSYHSLAANRRTKGSHLYSIDWICPAAPMMGKFKYSVSIFHLGYNFGHLCAWLQVSSLGFMKSGRRSARVEWVKSTVLKHPAWAHCRDQDSVATLF